MAVALMAFPVDAELTHTGASETTYRKIEMHTVARDWTPAQLLMRLAAMISPPPAWRLAPMVHPVAISDIRTTFGQRPSPRAAAAAQLTHRRK
jgi:hypothetical protein